MANWSLPGLADTYANFLAYLKDRDVDAVTMFKTGTPSNLPTGAVRLNRTAFRLEEWNGTAWSTPFATWAISISGNAATATSATTAAACSGNAATATTASAVAWTGVTGKPTTVAGFGITDAVTTARTVSTGTGLAGGGPLSGNISLSLANTTVTAGTYGSTAEITSFTVDGQGRLTAAGKTALTTAVASLAAAAGGTANALTVSYTPAITALVNGMVLVVRAATANTASAVTIAVNAVAAKAIVKGAGDPLAVGDIDGAGHWLVLVYDTTLGKFVLTNPAKSVSAIAPGQVGVFAQSTAPVGWLKANGAAVSRTTYADLFAAIGTTWGEGDGTTTFNVPDLRGEFIRGWDDGRGVDAARAFGSAQSAYAGTFPVSITSDDGDGQSGSFRSIYQLSIGGAFVDATSGPTSSTATVTPGDSRPRNVAMLACIKY